MNYIGSFSQTNFEKKQFDIELASNVATQTLNPDYNTLDKFKSFFNRMEYNRFTGLRYSVNLVLILTKTVEGPKKDSIATIYNYSIFTQSSFEIND